MHHIRAGATLAVGVALAVPSAHEFLIGNQAADQAALHVLAALAVAWVGVSVVAIVVSGYRTAAGPVPTPAPAPATRVVIDAATNSPSVGRNTVGHTPEPPAAGV